MGHGPRGLQPTGTRGTTSPTTRRAGGPTAGAKTACAGICDDQQRLCFALAFWNGRDPILKERLFGLTGSEGNHGEDVKEFYFYLDATPTHSYLKLLYKYPQGAFPYERLVERRPRQGRARIRAARHGRLRRGSLLRRVRRVREGRARRHPGPHQVTTAARSRRRSTCCRRSGFATPGRGTATATRPSLQAVFAARAMAIAHAPRRSRWRAATEQICRGSAQVSSSPSTRRTPRLLP